MLKKMTALLCTLALMMSMVFSTGSVVQAAECADVDLKVSFVNITAPERGKYAKAGDRVDLVFDLGEAKNPDGSMAEMVGYQFKVVYDPEQLKTEETYFTEAYDIDGWTIMQSNIVDRHEINGFGYMSISNAPSCKWEGGEFFRLHFTVVEDGAELDSLSIELPSTANLYLYGTQTDHLPANLNLQTVDMYIDNAAPSIQLEGKAAESSQSYDYYPIQVTAEDNSNDMVTITLDDKKVEDGAITKSGTLTVTDMAGNETSVEVNIQSENFDNVKKMIQALPDAEDATYENKADVAAIDTLLEKLSAEAKAKLDMTRYNAVKNVFADIDADIANVEKLIGELGTIDFTSGDKLQAVEQEINRLAQIGVKTDEYSNCAVYETAKATYDAIIAEVGEINQKLSVLGEWEYAKKTEYSNLQEQMKDMESDHAVPASEWNSNGVETLNAYLQKCAEAENAMDAVKTLIEALPENASVEDLTQINEASSEWDKLQSDYGLTEEQITARIGADMLEKLRAAENAVQESLNRIKAVEQRIDALYQDGKIQYGVQAEIEELERIIAGEGELNQAEIDAISQDSLDKLADAKAQLEALQNSIDELDAVMAGFAQPSYAEKDAYAEARTALETLKADYAVPETAFENLDVLVKAEAFIAEIESEIAAVREAYNGIPSVDEVKVTDEESLMNLQIRYDALLAEGVSEEEIAADTERLTAALAAIDALWAEAAQLNEKLSGVPETVTYTDQDGLVELQDALKALEKRGIAITADNYTNLPVYEKAWEALNAIIADIEKVEADIAALVPWKLGRNEQYQAILDQISQMVAVNVTEEDISNYGTLLECMKLEEQAQAALNEIIAEIEKLPTPCTEKDQQAVKAVQALVDALKQAPYQMTEDEIKDALNAMAGKDIYGILQQAIQDSMPEPSEPSEPSQPSEPSKPEDPSKPSEGGEDVSTGDMFPFAAAFALLISAGAMLVLKKKAQAK